MVDNHVNVIGSPSGGGLSPDTVPGRTARDCRYLLQGASQLDVRDLLERALRDAGSSPPVND
jgi:hypothetical protein